MTKKFKIKDLEEDPNLPAEKEELDARVIGKVSIDDLSDDFEIPIAPKTSSDPVSESLKRKEKNATQVENLVYFERSLFVSYLSKAISTFVALFCLDFVSHLMKSLDGVDVMHLKNYHSLFLSGSTNWIICKVAAFLIIVYFLATKKEIVMNKKGVYCTNAEISQKIFFDSRKVFVPWNKIKSVKLRRRLFEPYLFFYGEKNEKLGHLEFSIRSKENFFQYIDKYAGSDHPLKNIKKGRFLI